MQRTSRRDMLKVGAAGLAGLGAIAGRAGAQAAGQAGPKNFTAIPVW